MSFIKRLLKFIAGDKCETVPHGSALEGWNLQDTPFGCNGDIIANDKTIIFISHTNPIHTKATKEVSAWKDNRVEIAKHIPHGGMKWKFNVKFHKLPQTSDFVIFSQMWNKPQANFLCLSVKKSSNRSGFIKIELNKKQEHKTTTLYSFYMKQYDLCDVDLDVTAYGISGTINGEDVGDHAVDIWTKTHHELKYGMYWSGKIPYDQANHMVLEFKL